MNCRYEVWVEYLDGESVFLFKVILLGLGVWVLSSGYVVGGEGWSYGWL